MRKLYTAKRLTIIYFSLIAIALASLHLSVYQLTTNDLEQLYANNRLAHIKQYTIDRFATENVKKHRKIEVKTHQHQELDRGFTIYLDFSLLPPDVPNANEIPFDSAIEIIAKNSPTLDRGNDYFVQKSKINSLDGPVDVYFVVDNSLYELSERQLLTLHSKQIAVSLALLIVALIAVFKISDKLTRPTSELAKALSNRVADDLTPLPKSNNITTIEHGKLIDTFNHYQARIGESIERERSFNRFASHELRSPLMVMTGALNILEESQAPEVVEKQTKRLKNATETMTEFIDTLLSLTKSIANQEHQLLVIEEENIQEVVDHHQYLIDDKPISINIKIKQAAKITLPNAAFQILLGNVIKNAFSYTVKGAINIIVQHDRITVEDSGKGLSSEQTTFDGYGLGLLIVKELCHRYNYQFSLQDNENNGCSAIILFAHSKN